MFAVDEKLAVTEVVLTEVRVIATGVRVVVPV
jgi:hypothetical protein